MLVFALVGFLFHFFQVMIDDDCRSKPWRKSPRSLSRKERLFEITMHNYDYYDNYEQL